MHILVIGSGGREHALAWKLAQSKHVHKVSVAPGNPGTALEDTVENIPIKAMDISALVNYCQDNDVDFSIVGPEAPLAAGIVDAFQHAGLHCFGPTQAAAQLEASKAYCKAFMQRHGIPTAEYAYFTKPDLAKDYLQQCDFPIVLKTDGLAAGKGVIIAQDVIEGEAAVDIILSQKQFGEAGNTLIIEEFLQGQETSYIVVTDGTHYVPFSSSQDHKARFDGDTGPNTGGMGAYSPAPIVDPDMEAMICRTIIEPTLEGMRKDGNPYVGFLYAGVMVTPQGFPKVLEFNCRMGDPETQPLMLRMHSDLCELINSVFAKKLDSYYIEWHKDHSLGVVLISPGYPEAPQTGTPFTLPAPDDLPNDCKIFHAGTAYNDAGELVTAGGRVLCVTARGPTLHEAQEKAYALVDQLHFPGDWRKDIGHKGL